MFSSYLHSILQDEDLFGILALTEEHDRRMGEYYRKSPAARR